MPLDSRYAAQYRAALLDDVIPFWLEHSLDRRDGGYFSCLDRRGRVYDTDKFLWLQGREAWTFSALYNRLERRPEWLDAARIGIEFLTKHGRDEAGRWYFALDRAGNPVSQPWSIFADCFVAMGFSQYAFATGDEEARRIALESYDAIWRRRESGVEPFATDVGRTRRLIGFSLPMILINLCLELEWMLEPERVRRDGTIALDEIMKRFLDPERGICYECVAPDGSHVDCFEGRRVNPGHGVEAMWFVMRFADMLGDRATIRRAVDVAVRTLEFGWDAEHGGLFAFLDAEGHPPEQLEWDQKLWWAHLESIVTLLIGYNLTGDRRCLDWFERLHDYTWSRFPDPEFGEWYGYLNRRGEVLLDLKGGKWKGCFHVPRGLWMAWKELERAARPRPERRRQPHG